MFVPVLDNVTSANPVVELVLELTLLIAGMLLTEEVGTDDAILLTEAGTEEAMLLMALDDVMTVV